MHQRQPNHPLAARVGRHPLGRLGALRLLPLAATVLALFACSDPIGPGDPITELPRALSEVEEEVIAGQRALDAEGMYVIELPGGTQVVQISTSLDENDEGLSVSARELVELLAERIIAGRAE